LRIFFAKQRPVVAERAEVEELQSGDERLEGPLGHAQFIADVEEVLFDLLLRELIGREHVVGAELMNRPDIALAGSSAQAGKLQVAEHAVSEFGHRDTLS
jgi:hypothetical protein